MIRKLVNKEDEVYLFEEGSFSVYSYVDDIQIDQDSVYIYYLTDPNTKEVMYVGQTIGPIQRLKQHCDVRTIKNYFFRDWIISLEVVGKKPIMTVIEKTDYSTATSVEMMHIADQKEINKNLLNLTMIQHTVNVDRKLWYDVLSHVKTRPESISGYNVYEKVERFINYCIEKTLKDG